MQKKSIHEDTQGIMRNMLTVISPALILLTHLISAPIALNSHCQPQVREARHCMMAHLHRRGGSASRTPSLGEGERDRPGGAEMCRDVSGTQMSWAAAWQLPLSLLWWARQGCPRTALPPHHRRLCLRGEPLLASPTRQPCARRVLFLPTFTFEIHCCDLQVGLQPVPWSMFASPSWPVPIEKRVDKWGENL